MIFPLEDPELWALKYTLTIQKGKCPECGINIVTEKAFADGCLRGLISKDHGCGIENCLMIFKSLSEEDKGFFRDIFMDKYV